MSVSTDITNWTLRLKTWVATWVTNNAQKEEYGEEACECSWKRLMLANNLIDIMQCYSVSSSYNLPVGTTPMPDTCLEDSDMEHIFQLASSIVNYKGDC